MMIRILDIKITKLIEDLRPLMYWNDDHPLLQMGILTISHVRERDIAPSSILLNLFHNDIVIHKCYINCSCWTGND